MGFFNKLTPKKSSAAKTMNPLPTTAAPVGLPVTAPEPVAAEAPTAPLVTSSGAASDPNDVATYFTTFMLLYYGSFGITLLIAPSIWAADGILPFSNPMAYFTTISDEQAFSFRMVGTAFLTIVLGPFLDDIFGGAGVTFGAFARQVAILNTIFLFHFMFFTYYAPIANMIPFMWNLQCIACGIIFAWNVIEICPSSLPTYYTLATVAMFGFFALALVSIPDIIFGPPSPVAYWNTWTELGLMCARSLGLTMAIVFIAGYLLIGSSAGYAKLCTVWNVCLLGFCAIPAYFGGESAVAKMWEIQFVFQIPFVMVGLLMELKGTTGAWPCAFKLPPFGINAQTFVFVNVLFYVPFVMAFLTDPNMMFGPSTFTGFPMFTVDLDETALWFGRTWAVNIFLLSLGPFLFGFPVVKTVKLLTAAYLLFCGLFGYAIFAYSVLNLMVVAPLVGLNFVFFGLGLYLSLTSPDGEDLLYMA